MTGGGVRRRDAVLNGGDHHEVVDLRTLPGFRKKLVFGDGSFYVLADNAVITRHPSPGPRRYVAAAVPEIFAPPCDHDD